MIKIIFMKDWQGELYAIIDDSDRTMPSIMKDGKTADPISISHLISSTMGQNKLKHLVPTDKMIAGFAMENVIAIGRDLYLTHLNFMKYAGVADIDKAITEYCNDIESQDTKQYPWEWMARQAVTAFDAGTPCKWDILHLLKVRVEWEDSHG